MHLEQASRDVRVAVRDVIGMALTRPALLWKDHTNYREAARTTKVAALERPHYIA